ncbi:MAG: adenylate kinase [Clostridia bacterium]|nr:adenylate kinase [Clostridia bacterium]
MKRVLVIGCPGSGKTTFAKKLQGITGIPLHHLDAIWHRADRTHIERDEFDRILSKLLAEKAWIIDGNYGRTLEMRLKECDTVFLFDLPAEVSLQGAMERIGKKRDDIPWFEKVLDPEFQRWILSFSAKVLPKIYGLLEKYGSEKEIIIFKSRKEADDFLKSLP